VPNTKEEILRLFVTEHEKSPEKSEVLRNATLGFHREFLVGLAAAATDDATTAMSESRARQTIKRTEDRLLAEGTSSEPRHSRTPFWMPWSTIIALSGRRVTKVQFRFSTNSSRSGSPRSRLSGSCGRPRQSTKRRSEI
jgi:hypothetical protein